MIGLTSRLLTHRCPLLRAAVILMVGVPALAAASQTDQFWLSSQDPPPNTPLESLSPADQESNHRVQEQELLGGGTISHRITGSALRPRDSVVDFDISSSGGCIYAENNASDVFNTAMWLPQGSAVSTLRMYYNDTSESNSTAWFTVYDLYGVIVDEWSVNSSGNSGNGFNDTAAIDHVVDYNLYSYLVNWRPVAAGSGMQLCGFRIYYTPPSPLVFQDRFEQS